MRHWRAVLPVTSPSDAAFGRASSPARVRAYKEWIRMLLLYLSLYNNHAP